MTGGVFLFALEREMAPFRRQFANKRALRLGDFSAWECRGSLGEHLLIRTGMGAATVTAACQQILERSPRFVVLAGFSGGLAADLRVGDLVVAERIHHGADVGISVAWPWRNPGARRGPILTAKRVISTAAEKQRLHASTGALAVDLESASVAEFCQRQELPFACLRVISDGAQEELPAELETILHGERLRLGRLVLALWRRPGLLRDLLRLRAATQLAGDRLADGLVAAFSP